MYQIVVLIIFIALCESSDDMDLMAAGQIEANMNEYMDLVLIDAGPWIVNNGLDPLPLLEITKQFEYKPMFVPYHGQLHFSNGVLHNLKNISRSGNSVMHYGYKLMRIDAEVSMSNLNFRYDYDVNVMNLGPRGWIDGSVTNVNLHANFIVDLVDFNIFIQDFRITAIGSLDVKVRGNILFDWLGNVILKVVNSLYKTRILDFISERVRQMAEITIDGINKRMSIYDRREVAAKFFNDIEIKTMPVL